MAITEAKLLASGFTSLDLQKLRKYITKSSYHRVQRKCNIHRRCYVDRFVHHLVFSASVSFL